jgi:hypothetical protein
MTQERVTQITSKHSSWRRLRAPDYDSGACIGREVLRRTVANAPGEGLPQGAFRARPG